MQTIVIASKNPVKVTATENAFKRMFPDLEFITETTSAESGVGDQPLSEQETLHGAQNRATNAQIQKPDADYWVGIEGGVEEVDNELRSFAWIYIISKENKAGKGRTSTFFLPEKVAQLIREGMELGDADDVVFNKQNSKQQNGAIGILTGNVITRGAYYEEAAIIALIPFKNPDLY